MKMPKQQSIQKLIEDTVNSNQIVVFSKSWCPYCQDTKDLFRNPQLRSHTIQVIDLDGMRDGSAIQQELWKMTGQRTVPSVWVNGTFLGGNSETQSAWRNGSLARVLAQ